MELIDWFFNYSNIWFLRFGVKLADDWEKAAKQDQPSGDQDQHVMIFVFRRITA